MDWLTNRSYIIILQKNKNCFELLRIHNTHAHVNSTCSNTTIISNTGLALFRKIVNRFGNTTFIGRKANENPFEIKKKQYQLPQTIKT